MLSGANAFEISDIEGMNIGAASAGRLGGNNVRCPVVRQKQAIVLAVCGRLDCD